MRPAEDDAWVTTDGVGGRDAAPRRGHIGERDHADLHHVRARGVVRTELVGEGNAGDALVDEVDQLVLVPIARQSTIGSDGDPASIVGATEAIRPTTDALWEADPAAAGGAGNVARDGRWRRVVDVVMGWLEEPRELVLL